MRALQSAYEASLKKTGDELARRATAANAKYLTDLEALQKRVTMSGDIEQAIRIKNERTRFAAELAGGPAVQAPPVSEAPPVQAPPAAPSEPTTPAAAAKATGQGNDVESLLAGKWRFTNTRSGWTGIRTFNKDGTFKMDDGKDGGTWKVEGDQVHVSYNFGDTQDLALPIDPAGVNVKGTKGKTLVAVKEAP